MPRIQRAPISIAEIEVGRKLMREKSSAERGSYFDWNADWREHSCVLVDAIDKCVVAILVCDDQPMPGRIKVAVARRFALCGNVLYPSKPTGLIVDGEHADTVVATVGSINELPVRVYNDF